LRSTSVRPEHESKNFYLPDSPTPDFNDLKRTKRFIAANTNELVEALLGWRGQVRQITAERRPQHAQGLLRDVADGV
jgi:hypothetical protein